MVLGVGHEAVTRVPEPRLNLVPGLIQPALELAASVHQAAAYHVLPLFAPLVVH